MTALLAELASTKTFGPLLYFQANGLLYYKGRLCVLKVPALRAQLLSEHHDNPLAGHQGVERTTKLLKRYYYWPGMDEDARICADLSGLPTSQGIKSETFRLIAAIADPGTQMAVYFDGLCCPAAKDL